MYGSKVIISTVLKWRSFMRLEESEIEAPRLGEPFLLTPGPLTTSYDTKSAMLKDWGSWDGDFRQMTQLMRDQLIEMLGSGNKSFDCVPMQGSGSFSVEAMLGSFVPKDGKVLVLSNGAYGQRAAKTLKYLKGKPLTIRTLDVGNDKKVPSIDRYLTKSPNPALGLRAIRLTLAFPKIFKRQISAILRASKYGNIRIMLPMVSNVSELLEAKKLISDVRNDLLSKKIKILEKHVDIGVLIETPAAALISESIAKNCDFLAIGTNDLTMYTLAIDRGDEEVAKIYDPAHLSVLRLIKLSAESAKKVGVPISVCGEMAGDTMFTSLLLGMGIDRLSMSISRILKVKQFIENVNYEEVKKISDEILNQDDSVRIKQILKSYYDKIYSLINN